MDSRWSPPNPPGLPGVHLEYVEQGKVLSSLCKKWKQAKAGLVESFQALEELSSSASKEQIEEWEQQIKTANLNQATDLSAMDIYYVKVKEGMDQVLVTRAI